MDKKWIDVSVELSTELPTWPGDPALTISKFHSIDHGGAANVSELSLSVHTGTHMDAPFHFINKGHTMSSWNPDISIGIAKVFEIKTPKHITVEELKNLAIYEGDRVVFKTLNSSYEWFKKPFNKEFISFSDEGAEYLANKKVKLIGIDYLSVGGMHNGATVHNHLLGAGIWIIEGLYLHEITAGDYEINCMPVKIKDADGSPCRAIMKRID